MSSMSSRDTDLPVEQQHRHPGSQPADVGYESEDEQASVVDEDVVVIETHDAVDDRDPDAPEDREASPGTIWSSGASGPTDAMAEEPSAGDAAEGLAPDTAAPEDTGSASADKRQLSAWPPTGAPDADAGQWSEIKAMFVDDPGESVKRASGMVERAMENLMISLRERQESLASWQANDDAGTEELRNALRGYQSLFDQLDGISDRFRTGPDRVASA